MKLIKIISELEKPKHVYQKDKDEEDIEKRGFSTVPTEKDPITGRQGWDVVYTGDPKKSKRIFFNKTYETIKKLADEFEEVSQLKTYKGDNEMKNFSDYLRKLQKAFKAYIIKKGRNINEDKNNS